MSLPTPYLLGVRRLVEGGADAHGNPVTSYGDPQQWRVSAIQPGASERPDAAHRDASHILYTILAPATPDAPGAYDLVVLDGEEFAVEGQPRDWTRGPWGGMSFAGLVVELKRVEG